MLLDQIHIFDVLKCTRAGWFRETTVNLDLLFPLDCFLPTLAFKPDSLMFDKMNLRKMISAKNQNGTVRNPL